MGVIVGCLVVIVFGTLGLMWISERCQVPWEKEVAIGREPIVLDEEEILARVNWDEVEPNKVYAFTLGIGESEDDDWELVF